MQTEEPVVEKEANKPFDEYSLDGVLARENPEDKVGDLATPTEVKFGSVEIPETGSSSSSTQEDDVCDSCERPGAAAAAAARGPNGGRGRRETNGCWRCGVGDRAELVLGVPE